MDLREMPVKFQGRHPWEQSRARFFRAQLAAHLRPGGRVLDIGAGDGYLAAGLLPALRPGGTVVCFDAHYSDEHLERFSAAAPVGLSFTRRRPDVSFDVVLLLDVLEHVPDDRGFLGGIVRDLLRPGGVLLASVPAHPSLFTQQDAALGHHRRYRPAEFQCLLREPGLVVEATAGLFHSLLPLRAVQKLGELAHGLCTRPAPDATPEHADTTLASWHAGRWLTGAVLGLLALDNGLSSACARARITLPGLSVWALGRKP